VSELQGINHVAVTVTDLERSVPWYCEVLGLTQLMEVDHPAGDGRAVIVGKPDFSMGIGLHVHPTNESERFAEARTGLDHVGFLVKDRDELREWEARLTELGVDHSGYNDVGMYAVVVFRDPDNIQLELFTMA
jgi:catechol 2,3-dioxygenase-like lactoylglutathione lyase family enzyme